MTWIRLDPDEIQDVGRAIIEAADELGAVRGRLLGLAESGGLGEAGPRVHEALASHAEAVRLLGAIHAVLGIDVITRAIRLLQGESLASAVSVAGADGSSSGPAPELVPGLAGSVVGGSSTGWSVDISAVIGGGVVGGSPVGGTGPGLYDVGFVGGGSGLAPMVVGSSSLMEGLGGAVVGGSWSPEPPPTDDQLRARALGAQLEAAARSAGPSPVGSVSGDFAHRLAAQNAATTTLEGIYRTTQIIGANQIPTTSGLERAYDIHLERLFGSPV